MATYSATGSICKYYKMDLIVSESNVNNATNESTVNYTLKLTSSGGYWFELIGSTVKITIGGVVVFEQYSKKNITQNDSITIASDSIVIKHNPDGSKSVDCVAEWTQNSTSSYTPGKMTASGNLPLTTIPRESTIACADFNIGSSAIVVVTKASSDFLHTVTYNIGGLTGTIGTAYSSDTTLAWDTSGIATSIYSKIPTATSIQGKLYCTTYNASKTQVGSAKETTFTAFVVNSNPTIVINSANDTNSKTMAVTDSDAKLVNLMSNATVSVTATSKNAAKIKNIKILTSDGGNANSDRAGTETSVNFSQTFNKVKSNGDTYTIEAQVTDTRNLTNVSKVTLVKSVSAGTWIKYIEPAITSIDAERESSTSGNVTLTFKANKWVGSFGTTTNATVLQWRYRLSSSSSWINSYQNISATSTSGNTLSYSAKLPVSFDFSKDYIIEVRVADSLTEDTATVPVLRGSPIIDIGEQDVNVNGTIKQNGSDLAAAISASVAKAIYPVGSIYISANSTNPGTLFAGTTWTQIKDRFLLAAGDTYANGATGGEATHTLTTNEMPSHTHTISSSGAHKHTFEGYLQTSVSNSTTYLSISRKRISGDPEDTPPSMVNNSGGHTHTPANTGGGAAHNNMPPYLAVYVWKRTA